MKPVIFLRLMVAGLAIVGGAACSDVTTNPAIESPAAAQTVSDTDAAVAQIFAEGNVRSDERPAFSKDTVLKLNPIVARSKAALDRFDELMPQLAAAREARDADRISAIETELPKLKAETDAALTAFRAEKAALLSRKEYFDEVIFAAMEQFVTEAPSEIAEALAPATK